MLPQMTYGLIVVLLSVSPLFADTGDVLFNQVFIDAQAEGEVVNDTLEVLMQVEKQGGSPEAIARQVNQTMQWALDRSKPYKAVEVSTRSYQTHPLYRDRLITGWRATQQLHLKSTEIAGLTELIGKLQEQLQVQQMNFLPGKKTRVKRENELINEAMEAFKQRVEIVKGHMEGKNYRIVDLRVNTGQSVPALYRERMATMAVMEADAAPAVEAGTSTVVVTVSGSVQFY